jgi:hypothetical protein
MPLDSISSSGGSTTGASGSLPLCAGSAQWPAADQLCSRPSSARRTLGAGRLVVPAALRLGHVHHRACAAALPRLLLLLHVLHALGSGLQSLAFCRALLWVPCGGHLTTARVAVVPPDAVRVSLFLLVFAPVDPIRLPLVLQQAQTWALVGSAALRIGAAWLVFSDPLILAAVSGAGCLAPRPIC